MEEPVDITPYLDQLDESLRDKVLQLQKGRWAQPVRLARGSSPELCLVLRGQQGGRLGGHVLGARRGSWSCVRCLLQFRGLGLGAGRPRSPAPQFSLCEF